MLKKGKGAAALMAAMLAASGAAAQDPIRIGLILPMTGPFASTGRQVEAAARLYRSEHCESVAGRPVEIVLRDDTGVPDVTRRIAQELVVNEGVSVLAGFGLTPLAFATAPLATQAGVPMVVMAAATSAITEQSPLILRSSFTLPQVTVPLAAWAAENGIKRVMTLVTDYAPGVDAETAFKERFSAAGGEIVSDLRVPLRNPDFAPFLQRVADAKPDAVFVFVPSGVGATFMKQFVERGLDKSGIRLIATGDVTDDDILNDMGQAALGTTTTHHYSAAHDSPQNKAFVEAFRKANNFRPNFMAVGGYDGMRLICEGFAKTQGEGGEKLVEAVKGMSFESPRGPVSIDPQTRDIVQNVYVRRVENVGGELFNVEFETTEMVKDPAKEKK